MSAQTIYQENAARFATTAESVDEQLAVRRGEGIAQAGELIYAGSRQLGYFALVRSFLDQLAIAGIESANIPGMPGHEPPGLVRRRTGGRHAADDVAVSA